MEVRLGQESAFLDLIPFQERQCFKLHTYLLIAVRSVLWCLYNVLFDLYSFGKGAYLKLGTARHSAVACDS